MRRVLQQCFRALQRTSRFVALQQFDDRGLPRIHAERLDRGVRLRRRAARIERGSTLTIAFERAGVRQNGGTDIPDDFFTADRRGYLVAIRAVRYSKPYFDGSARRDRRDGIVGGVAGGSQ